jgi:2-succinyl-5-enolpyruvyl-6-hydroxy-3-cyclohexene-1-carboxylate synthase
VSRVLAEWVASSGAEQVAVEMHGVWFDPDRSLHALVVADPGPVCAALADLAPAPAPEGWLRRWSAAEAAAQEAVTRTLSRHPEPTEPGVARTVLSGLAPGTTLVVASSMPIRDVEWYGPARGDVRVVANRGANGIDGTLATILGVAAGGAGQPGAATVGLVGDLAFLHDAGALVGAADRDLDAVIVVVDNGGGGIFSFLPQATAVAAPVHERLFGTPHTVDLVALADVHGLPATELSRAGDLAPAVRSHLEAGGISVLVLRTDRRTNVEVHDEIHAAVARALDSAVS